MASASFSANGYVMGSRIPIRDVNPINMTPTPASPIRIASRIIGARDEQCTGSATLCEKPVDPASLTLPITLGVTIPIVGALFLLYYFHRRNMRRQAQEDATDPNRGLDFGLGDAPIDKGGKKRKSLMFREKGMGIETNKQRQLSMDMNLSSPYLLPPGLQSSRESLNSLARTLHNEADPYRPVYASSDAGSIYTKTTSRRGSSMTGRTTMTQNTLPPRQTSLPRPPPATADPLGASRSGSPSLPPTSPAIRSPLVAEPVIPQIETVPSGSSLPQIPDVPEPEPVAQRGLPGNSRPSPGHPTILEAREPENTPADQTNAPVGLGLDDLSFPATSHRLSPPAGGALPSSPRPQKEAAPSTLPAIVPEETNAHDRHDQDQDYQDYQDFDFEDRGRSHRRSVDDDNRQSRVLGVPAQDGKRLSVGFRPLPPDDVMESEDPEERANRIRSFYKEYFDPDNPHAAQEPPPPMPRGPHRGPQGGAQYYEDYDPGYSGGSPGGDAYFDPETNSFVMPYAQPVTRRAMTPPPNGSRFRGPPPPRGMHGSMGGGGGRMASPGPGGRRPPPRVGSGMSSGLGPSRRGSDMSSQYTPRPGSSVSNMTNGGRPKPKGPPPADLTTLPNPSKLKDDSFSILNPLDFAPPETFADRARGRSQSPSGERRPYAPKVPVHSPLVSSFEEMPAMPSPHLLRKSGTFTGLDFAPPRKFKDADTMSDAGSIRSNRSGISAVQQAAIRSGAGRISRLPGDTVFTTTALQDQLKPQWGMRP
ncbi:hypothetical protein CGRA01v4_00850 [Colletotrichum graminicola]|uniref:Uncharacterized protein n=1 Tax=Colletotrichum graminicola (strain M1.001 / M2 / FGSC 10212) TaxID=645133 RepID=E3QRD6_COLGM|nr:uncharacterized protein GLRG_08703 [Colletotrichum graminicola M1.001]EFQ33424.1 hypothetical protein GLRG_08703 [Colletotrichum graminicola M1.001]WDK09572.1 hypothetical protein CGRA01v4_00850 [Colletotrichum graminicola]